eukprot:TRINITY_DN9195_c0_g1_i2.p1 TRINITY_DN9195_c0_g1~~TRINITY_DN9195_c0_g1_i2.p1  ORF type:complete len:270 (+),score=48.04 TRINITY_DN9195_c0_g1_i2:16-825(+)
MIFIPPEDDSIETKDKKRLEPISKEEFTQLVSDGQLSELGSVISEFSEELDFTYVFYALLNNHIEVARLLVENGANFHDQRILALSQYHPEFREEIFPLVSVCSICEDDKEMVYLSCCHSFCGDCIYSWIIAELNNLKTEFICPDNECSHQLLYHEVIGNIKDDEIRAQYIRRLFESFVSTIDDFVWCPKCDFGGIKSDDFCATCEKCDHSFCVQCYRDNHIGFTCEEYEEITENDNEELYMVWFWKKKNSKVCPKCRCSIEKNGTFYR